VFYENPVFPCDGGDIGNCADRNKVEQGAQERRRSMGGHAQVFEQGVCKLERNADTR
jgi:hypothetical protein